MKSIFAHANVTIYGSRNSWSVSPMKGYAPEGTPCRMALEIQGSDREGYNLVMSPDGFFTADSWHPTETDAREAAERIFGIGVDAWTKDRP